MLIDGRALAEKIKDEIAKEVSENCLSNSFAARPSLAIILVGEREDSQLYVSLKEREAKKVGIDTSLYKFIAETKEDEIIEAINFLNQDESVDAILVQLPLPAGINTDKVIKAVNPAKDIDGFHPENLRTGLITQPVFGAVEKILESIQARHNICQEPCCHDNDDGAPHPPSPLLIRREVPAGGVRCISTKKICIISNSKIFGDNLKIFLENKKLGETIVCRADDKDLINKTKAADILITAAGKPKFIKKEMIKKDAVIIDIGITKVENKFCGDVDFEDVKNKAGYITPVPGGVGPLTIAMALRNTLDIFKKNKLHQYIAPLS